MTEGATGAEYLEQGKICGASELVGRRGTMARDQGRMQPGRHRSSGERGSW
jgi:hypothetical protein